MNYSPFTEVLAEEQATGTGADQMSESSPNATPSQAKDARKDPNQIASQSSTVPSSALALNRTGLYDEDEPATDLSQRSIDIVPQRLLGERQGNQANHSGRLSSVGGANQSAMLSVVKQASNNRRQSARMSRAMNASRRLEQEYNIKLKPNAKSGASMQVPTQREKKNSYIQSMTQQPSNMSVASTPTGRGNCTGNDPGEWSPVASAPPGASFKKPNPVFPEQQLFFDQRNSGSETIESQRQFGFGLGATDSTTIEKDELADKDLKAVMGTAELLAKAREEKEQKEQATLARGQQRTSGRVSLKCANVDGGFIPKSRTSANSQSSDDSEEGGVHFASDHDEEEDQGNEQRRFRVSQIMDRMQHGGPVDAEAVRYVLVQQRFDICMGVIIFINCIVIGMEASCQPTKYRDTYNEGCPGEEFFSVAEHVFLAIYVTELLARFWAFGVRVSMQSNWVRFDCFLVGTGVISTWILTPLFKGTALVGQSRLLVLAKILRVVRLARALRLFVQFRHLWLLVRGLFASGLVMIWSFLMIFMLLFFFAVLGVDFIGTNESLIEHNDPDVREQASRFSELSVALVTLTSFWLLDDVGEIYKPLIFAQPILSLYFLMVVLVIAVSCMNLVTAIMVQNSIDSAEQDKEAQNMWEAQRRRNLVPKLVDLFHKLDADNSGDLTKEEILQAPHELTVALQKVGHIDNLFELFEALDVDGSGVIEIDEFCAGMLKASGETGKPVELLRISKQVDHCVAVLENLEETLEERELRELGLSDDDGLPPVQEAPLRSMGTTFAGHRSAGGTVFGGAFSQGGSSRNHADRSEICNRLNSGLSHTSAASGSNADKLERAGSDPEVGSRAVDAARRGTGAGRASPLGFTGQGSLTMNEEPPLAGDMEFKSSGSSRAPRGTTFKGGLSNRSTPPHLSTELPQPMPGMTKVASNRGKMKDSLALGAMTKQPSYRSDGGGGVLKSANKYDSNDKFFQADTQDDGDEEEEADVGTGTGGEPSSAYRREPSSAMDEGVDSQLLVAISTLSERLEHMEEASNKKMNSLEQLLRNIESAALCEDSLDALESQKEEEAI